MIEQRFVESLKRAGAWHHWLGSDYMYYILHPYLDVIHLDGRLKVIRLGKS